MVPPASSPSNTIGEDWYQESSNTVDSIYCGDLTSDVKGVSPINVTIESSDTDIPAITDLVNHVHVPVESVDSTAYSYHETRPCNDDNARYNENCIEFPGLTPTSVSDTGDIKFKVKTSRRRHKG